MISLFPPPYPDEHIDSIAARYAELLGYRSRVDINFALYDQFDRITSHLLPTGLQHLANNISSDYFSADYLLWEHTPYPYFSIFMSDDAEKRHLRSYMLMNPTQFDPKPIDSKHLPSKKFYSYCPECVSEDRQAHGETYWHRLHQVLGVSVCYKHFVWLESTNIKLPQRDRQNKYDSAEKTISDSLESPRPLDLNDKDHLLLLNIAKDIALTFGKSRPKLYYGNFARQFERLLRISGFNLENFIMLSKPNVSYQLAKHISSVVSKSVYATLEFTFPTGQSRWLCYSLQAHQHGYTGARLVLIHILDHALDTFVKPFFSYPFFEEGRPLCSEQNCAHKGITELNRRFERRTLEQHVPSFFPLGIARYQPSFFDHQANVLEKSLEIRFRCSCGGIAKLSLWAVEFGDRWWFFISGEIWLINLLELLNLKHPLDEIASISGTNIDTIYNIVDQLSIEEDDLLVSKADVNHTRKLANLGDELRKVHAKS